MEALGGMAIVLAVVVAVVLIVLAAFWISLPFILVARLADIRKSVDRINHNLENLMRAAETYMNEMLKRQ